MTEPTTTIGVTSTTTTAQARIAALVEEALSAPRYPHQVVTLIQAYLSGEAEVEPLIAQMNPATFGWPCFDACRMMARHFYEGPHSDPDALDALDRRIIDYFLAADDMVTLFRGANDSTIAEPERRILLICEELRARGETRASVASQLSQATHLVEYERVMPTGRALITLYDNDLDAIGEIVDNEVNAWNILELLSRTRPEQRDLLWSLVPLALQYWSNWCVGLMLRVDPERAVPWAAELIATPGRLRGYERHMALWALLKHDFAANIETAIAVARDTSPDSHADADASVYALRTVYESDPSAYLWLVEECAVSPVDAVAERAVELLAAADFARAAPGLRHCATAGASKTVAAKALAVLLDHEWPGRDDFAIARLGARSARVRETAARWLERQDERVLPGVAAYLAHADPKVRALAALVVGRVGGDDALHLLRGRLGAETKPAARDAITQAISVAEARRTLAPSARSVIAEAEAALARAKNVGAAWFDVAQAPQLRWRDGQPVAPIVVRYLTYSLARTSPAITELDARVAAIVADEIDHATSGDFAEALLGGWLANKAKAKDSWLLLLVGALGDDRLVLPLRTQVEKRCWTAATIARKALNGIAAIGSDSALSALSDLAVVTPAPTVREHAYELFDHAAAQRGQTPADLADAIVPTFGFDTHSERTFDYGPRQFVARLGVAGALTLTERRPGVAPKLVKSLPQPNARDDATLGQAAHAEWPALKAESKAAAAQQARHLEDAMLKGREWDVIRWRDIFLRQPFLRLAATTLVWGLLTDRADDATNPNAPYAQVFRPLEDGTLTGADDTPITLPAEGAVRLVHPAELTAEAHARWRQRLADYEVKPVFPQLERTVIRLSDKERGAQWWEGLAGQQFNTRQERRTLDSTGWRTAKTFNPPEWQTHPLNERGYYGPINFDTCYYRRSPQFDGWDLMRVTYLSSEQRDDELWQWRIILGLGFTRDATFLGNVRTDPPASHPTVDGDPRLLSLGEVSSVALSELISELQQIVARGRYDPDWRDKVF